MANRYFTWVPKDHGDYEGRILLPEEVKDRWYEISFEIETYDHFIEWYKLNFSNSPFVVILFAIWGGVDRNAIFDLIEISRNFSDVHFFYRFSNYYEHCKLFFPDKKLLHSPVVFFGDNQKLERVLTGIVPFEDVLSFLSRFKDDD